jgi:hypothetical protein
MAINRLFEHFQRSLCLNFSRLAEIGHREFLTLEKPLLRDFLRYVRISLAAQVPITHRFGFIAKMLSHQLSSARRRDSKPSPSAQQIGEAHSTFQFPRSVRRAA